jgi:hypothetical protein
MMAATPSATMATPATVNFLMLGPRQNRSPSIEVEGVSFVSGT